jgi:hypothetical protein
MSTAAVIVLVVVVVVVLALGAFAARPALRRKRLRQTFGPEYDRTVESADDQRSAEAELERRQRRHAEFELKPLGAEERERYRQEWIAVQAEFVDAPKEAVAGADELIGRVMADRGYPTGDHEQQAADLSVEHGEVLGHYRRAHTISQRPNTDPASTEDLREAMVHYRTLFDDLVGNPTPERSHS